MCLQGDLESFLATAELAGTEFTAEKLNVHIAQGPQNEAFISEDRRKYVVRHGCLFGLFVWFGLVCLFFVLSLSLPSCLLQANLTQP
jgi:hypothetical protein